jgi:hypothetical protein
LDGLNEEGTKVDGEEDVGSDEWYSDWISVGTVADVGNVVGITVGDVADGDAPVGLDDGLADGISVGNADARTVVGKEDVNADGEIVGLGEGDAIEEKVGLDDGHSDGISVGIEE